jgi:hypothetical protein
MARPSDIKNEELRTQLETAFGAMRKGQGGEAVRLIAAAYLRFLEIHPEAKAETIPFRGYTIPRVMRWPGLGANLKPESLSTGRPEIEFTRERFAASEAMTYYQFVLDEILAKEETLG